MLNSLPPHPTKALLLLSTALVCCFCGLVSSAILAAKPMAAQQTRLVSGDGGKKVINSFTRREDMNSTILTAKPMAEQKTHQIDGFWYGTHQFVGNGGGVKMTNTFTPREDTVPPTQIDNADAIADADLALLRSVNGTVDRPEVVRDLLQRRKANVNACDEWGQTVLKWAVWWGLAGSVRVLLDHGADVNAASTDGGAPLHMAVYQGENDIAELLVKRGANLSAQRFSYCEEDYNINNHKMMCRDPMRPLDMVVARRDCHMLETMLGHSNWTISAIVAAVNEPAPSSRPANEFPRWPVLENAIEMGLVDCVRVLLAHGANASAELFSWGRRFETPLIKAARERPALIRLLIEQGGAFVDQRDWLGKTALHHAVSYNPYVSDADDPATVLALLDAGADPRARYCLLPSPSPDACDAHPGLATYKFWATPAMLAIQNNLYKVAELLLKAEAQQKSS